MPIRFFSEGISFKLLHPRTTSNWIQAVAENESAEIAELNYIFCSDRHLQKINKDYLSHDSLTDIITFGYSEFPEAIHGDIFISVPRVRENARKFEAEFDRELHRVIVHGLLHLIGYGDKKKAEKALMRKKEEAYLSLRR